MTDPNRIEALLAKIQEEFLEKPQLKLTRRQAAARFGVDEVMCGAVLRALADASVLVRTPTGAYTRFFPHHFDRVA